nr:3-carboxy-cis,cis-muconate cycloisomerase [uncultured Cohaesibacter sp.]
MSSFIADNACFAPLFADEEIDAHFCSERQMALMLAFEMELTRALVDHGLVEQSVGAAALAAMMDFSPDIMALGQGSLQDGLPVPAFVRSLKSHVEALAGAEAVAAVHVGATSQDLVDTVLVLNLRAVSLSLSVRLARVIERLERLARRFGARSIMARTRMQAALPILVSDRLDSWVMPLRSHLSGLPALRQRVELLQFGGPVGTRNGLGGKGDAIAAQLAEAFNLGNPSKAWHSMREPIVAYGDFLSMLSASLGKMGMDICLMAQQGGGEIKLGGSGTSSAMPHKQNPVLAEMLVAFARFNGVQLSGLHHGMVHEQERSGMAWTLEWMILPLMAATAGKALSHAEALLSQVESMGNV